MELQVNIKTRAEEVFDELQKALLEDIKMSTGKEVLLEKLEEGYSYKKKLNNYLGNTIEVTVNINKLNYPVEYSATITNSKGSNTIEYILEPKEESVNLKYIEHYKANSFFGMINYNVMALFFTKGNKKKMQKKFSFLENQIIAKRKTNKN